MTIESSLLFKREDGTQGFVHDSYLDFFLAQALSQREVLSDDITRKIRTPLTYSFYSAMVQNSDLIVLSLLNLIKTDKSPENILDCINSCVSSASGISYGAVEKAVSAENLSGDWYGFYPWKVIVGYKELIKFMGSRDILRLSKVLRSRNPLNGHIYDEVCNWIKKNGILRDETLEESLVCYLPLLGCGDRIINLFDLFVRFGGDQVTEALSGYAQQKDSTYWWRAVEVMGRRKDENAVPGLIETLKIHKDTQTKGRILAVDDDSRDRDFYQDFLELENYQCICVDCDEKALDYLNEERFDLLISDVNHLELGGFSLFREVRRMYDCPILCISASGYSREPREQQVMQLTDAYMSKPINLREFANVVGSLIRLPLLFPNSASYIYHALEGIGPKAIPLLNPFLQDQDPYIRENVTQFIHNLENAAHN